MQAFKSGIITQTLSSLNTGCGFNVTISLSVCKKAFRLREGRAWFTVAMPEGALMVSIAY